MSVYLVSHINGDGDILSAWFNYYSNLGVASFHLIVHGRTSENTRLFELARKYPVVIEDAYEGEFTSEEKKERINKLLEAMKNRWILLVDSDEFVEFPGRSISSTIRKLNIFGANALSAPMLQHMTVDGTLESPDNIPNPFERFPLCSINLYRAMGVHASTSKYPLFRCNEHTLISEGGNHKPPNGAFTKLSPLQGITHHFKWRAPVLLRLKKRASSSHTWRHESANYLAYLRLRGMRLPTANTFQYSRKELWRRGLLRVTVQESRLEQFEKDYWSAAVSRAIQEILGRIPATARLILVDDGQFGDIHLAHPHCLPFLEKGGRYWGRPQDDETAIVELERQRQRGATFIAFAWPAFWWLDYYDVLHRYLRSKFQCVFENEQIFLFDLRI